MGKGQPAKESTTVYEKKGKMLTLCSNLEISDGVDVIVDEDVDEWEPELLITSSCDSVTVSEFKPGKRGLNSRPRPVLHGGGGDGSHTLPNHVTGKGRSTRHSWRVIKPTRGTAKNFQFPHGFAVRSMNTKYYYYFDWGRWYNQVLFPVIQ